MSFEKYDEAIKYYEKAVESGKTIRFSHNPNGYGDCALKWEWDYSQEKHGFLC